MERGVIETFDLLRPEVDPHFLMSYTTKRKNLTVLDEIRARGLSHSFFSDLQDWPRIGKPRSASEAWSISSAMLKGNRDVWKAATNADVIYIASINYFYFALLHGLFRRSRSKRIIFHFHDLLSRPSRQLKALNYLITDYVHNTELSKVVATEANPFITSRRNRVISYPLVRTLDGSESSQTKTSQSILFVGQVARHKGVDLLLDAYEKLKLRHPQLMLDVVGGCDDPELIRRMDLMSANGKPGVRRWGYRSDVLAMMKAADIYVQPSLPSLFAESFGRGVVEAMSVGTPSICFESGALKEIVRDGETGLICKQETADCLVEKIELLLTDNDLRRRFGSKASALYEKKYSNNLVKSKWLELLTSE